MRSASDRRGPKALRSAAIALASAAALFACRSTPIPPATEIDLLADGALLQTVAPGTGAVAAGADALPVALWSFEDEPVRWRIDGRRETARGGATDETAYAGRRSFCIESSGADADARAYVPAAPERRYRLEGHARTFALGSTAGARGTFRVDEYSDARGDGRDSNHPTARHDALPASHGASEQWIPLRYEFSTRASTRMLRIAAGLSEAGGRFCFDEVALFEIGPAATPADGWRGAVRQIEVGGELRRALEAPPRSEFRHELTVPPRAWLSFAIGIESRPKTAAGDGVVFTVEAAVDGRRDVLFTQQTTSGALGTAASWIDAHVSLAAYDGRRIQLVFATAASNPLAVRASFAGDAAAWANPVVFSAPPAGENPDPPDVFLITIDALRPDHLGCYGYARDTSPAIDHLASEGVLFENAFTTIPRTTPGLASLMSGLYPRAHGLMTLLHGMHQEVPTLAEVLQRAGYVTGAIVTPNIFRRSGLQRGFDSFDDQIAFSADPANPALRAERLAAKAAQWVNRNEGRRKFLWLHVLDPHFEYLPPAPYDRWFDPEFDGDFDLYERLRRGGLSRGRVYFQNDLTPRQLEHAVALYDGEIRYTDAVLAELFRFLRQRGLYERSLVIVTADHGESLGEHGYFFEHGEYLYDEALRIPMIVKFPFSRTAGRRVAGTAMILDLMPTILSAAGVATPPVAGKNLELFLDGRAEPHASAFHETERRFFEENPRRPVAGIAGNWKSVRSGGWKLIRIPDRLGDQHELYDLRTDRSESHDVYRPDHPEAIRLATQLEAWLESFERPSGEQEGAERTIDAATAERLRALGYLDTPAAP